MVVSKDNLIWDLSTLTNLRRYAHLSNPHLSRDQFKSLWSMAVSATICLGENAEKFGQILSHSDNPFGLSFERLIEKRRRRASRRPRHYRLCSKSRHVIEPLGVGSGREHAAWLALLPRDTESGTIVNENQQSKDHIEIILKTFHDILSMLGKVRRAKLRHRKWRKIVAVKMAAGRFNLGRKTTQIIVTSVDDCEHDKTIMEKTESMAPSCATEPTASKMDDVKQEDDTKVNALAQATCEKMAAAPIIGKGKKAVGMVTNDPGSMDAQLEMAPEMNSNLDSDDKTVNCVEPKIDAMTKQTAELTEKNDSGMVQNEMESEMVEKMAALNVMEINQEHQKLGPEGDSTMEMVKNDDEFRVSTPTIKVTKSCRPGQELVSTLKAEMIKKKMIHPNTLQKQVCELTSPKTAHREFTRSLSSASLLGADLMKKKLKTKIAIQQKEALKQITAVKNDDEDDDEGEIPLDGMMDSNFCGQIKSTPMALVVPTILSNSILLKKMTAAAANKEIMADALAWDFFRSRRRP